MLLVSKEKIGGNHAFSEITKLSIIWKEVSHIALYFTVFLLLLLLLNYLSKMHGYFQFSFWIPMALNC